MFKILDGRKSFYQWDINRKIIINDESIKEVHFCNRQSECSLVVEVNDGVANVPNIMLQTNHCINVYAYDGEATRHSKTFLVKARSKPEDYVYTETEIKNYDSLKKLFDDGEAKCYEYINDEIYRLDRAGFLYIHENCVLKSPGKGLSTNDFTDEYKAKLDALISQLYKDGESNG